MNQITALSVLAVAVIAACGANQNKPSDRGPGQSKSPDNVSVQADGTITSGGGYIYGYEANPWFLGNVDKVKYCVDIDEDHFGISRAKAEESIERAVALWKKSFKGATFENHREEPAGTLVIGTQDFEQVSCDEGVVDIRFQLGKLTTEQRKIIKNPRQYVGVTVQEQYDEEQMRGRGFIYIAPEAGDLRPEADDLANNFWRYDDQVLLDGVLTHELGHVFGLGHNSSHFPMAAEICEGLVTNGSIASFEKIKNSQTLKMMYGLDSARSMFNTGMANLFNNHLENTWIPLYQNSKFLGLDDVNLSLESMLRLDLKSGAFKASTWSVTWHGDDFTEIKKVRDLDLKFEKKETRTEELSLTSVRIPKNQKIMTIPREKFQDLGSLTANFSVLDLVSISSEKTTGYLINSKGEKIFTIFDNTPAWHSSRWMSINVNVVSNNELIDLN